MSEDSLRVEYGQLDHRPIGMAGRVNGVFYDALGNGCGESEARVFAMQDPARGIDRVLLGLSIGYPAEARDRNKESMGAISLSAEQAHHLAQMLLQASAHLQPGEGEGTDG